MSKTIEELVAMVTEQSFRDGDFVLHEEMLRQGVLLEVRAAYNASDSDNFWEWLNKECEGRNA